MGVRRKTVVGHWQRPGDARADRRAGRARPAAGTRPRSCASPASATTCATSPSPRATRSRRSCGWASRSTATGSATSPTPSRRPRRPRSTTLVADYERRYELAPELREGGARRSSLVDAARIEAGLRAFLEDGGFGAFTDTFEDLHGAAPAARDRRAAADGRRLRLRRRGRLEDRRAGADPQGDGDAASPAGPRSWRTTPTTSSPPSRWCSARTCSRSARRSPPRRRPARSTRSRSAAARIPVRLVFDAAPGPGRRRRAARPRRPLPHARQRGRRRRAAAAAAEAAGGARASGARRPTSRPRPRPGSPPAARTTPCFSGALDVETIADFAEIAGARAAPHRRATRRLREFRNELRWNEASYRLGPAR